jgi:hypothetical protein
MLSSLRIAFGSVAAVLAAPGALLTGFAAGILLMLFTVYLPSQRILREREQSINQLAEFNRHEQQRVAEVRDLTFNQVQDWVAKIDQANTRFMDIQRVLHKQEMGIANQGFYLVLLAALVVASTAVSYFVFLGRDASKDSVVLDTFETAVRTRLQRLQAEARPMLVRQPIDVIPGSKSLSDSPNADET